jgi:hypothetical protein
MKIKSYPAAFATVFCLAAGFALPAYAGPTQAPSSLNFRYGLFFAFMYPTLAQAQAAAAQDAKEELLKCEIAVEQLKKLNAALEARVKELEQKLATYEAQGATPKPAPTP